LGLLIESVNTFNTITRHLALSRLLTSPDPLSLLY